MEPPAPPRAIPTLMNVKTLPLTALLLGVMVLPLSARDPSKVEGNPITEVAHFDDYQVTGIAVDKAGQLYANFPRWSNDYKYAVAAVGPNSSLTPFPDERWNSWKDKDPDVANKWVCVQSITVDDTGALWVLDTGNPGMNGTLPGGPKLVKFDLRTRSRSRKLSPSARTSARPRATSTTCVSTPPGRWPISPRAASARIIVVDLKKRPQARRTAGRG